MPPLLCEVQLGDVLVSRGVLSSIELEAMFDFVTEDELIPLLGDSMLEQELISAAELEPVLAELERARLREALEFFAEKLAQQKLVGQGGLNRTLEALDARPAGERLTPAKVLALLAENRGVPPSLLPTILPKFEALAGPYVSAHRYGPDVDNALAEPERWLRIAVQHRLLTSPRSLKLLLLKTARKDQPLGAIAVDVKVLTAAQVEAIDRVCKAGVAGIAGIAGDAAAGAAQAATASPAAAAAAEAAIPAEPAQPAPAARPRARMEFTPSEAELIAFAEAEVGPAPAPPPRPQPAPQAPKATSPDFQAMEQVATDAVEAASGEGPSVVSEAILAPSDARAESPTDSYVEEVISAEIALAEEQVVDLSDSEVPPYTPPKLIEPTPDPVVRPGSTTASRRLPGSSTTISARRPSAGSSRRRRPDRTSGRAPSGGAQTPTWALAVIGISIIVLAAVALMIAMR